MSVFALNCYSNYKETTFVFLINNKFAFLKILGKLFFFIRSEDL